MVGTEAVSVGRRKPRADAQRNRILLLETAKTAFGDVGPEIGLEDIARRAGVGIGTLYRHFPTRNALVEAVYRHEVERLAEAATTLTQTHRPVDALRAWMQLFIDLVTTKKLIASSLNAIVGGPSELYASSSSKMKAAITSLVDRAIDAGEISRHIEPFDLLRALVGVANVNMGDDWEAAARRLVDILIAGIQKPLEATHEAGGRRQRRKTAADSRSYR